jgi:hypothetical protein
MQRSQTESENSSTAPIDSLNSIEEQPSAPQASEYTLSRNYPMENYRTFGTTGRLYATYSADIFDLLSESEQKELENERWFQVGLPRELSLQILLQQPPGSFLIRQSESHKQFFALSIRAPPLQPPKLSHYLIQKSSRGTFHFKGYLKEFSSLKALVVHHSLLKEHLPAALVVPSRDFLLPLRKKERNKVLENRDKSPSTTLCFRRSKEK